MQLGRLFRRMGSRVDSCAAGSESVERSLRRTRDGRRSAALVLAPARLAATWAAPPIRRLGRAPAQVTAESRPFLSRVGAAPANVRSARTRRFTDCPLQVPARRATG